MTPDDDVDVPESLSFLVAVDEDDDDTMGLFRSQERDIALRQVPVAVLRANLRRAVAALREILDDAAIDTGRLRLREAQVQFEISAKGGIHLIGTSELATKGALTLVFREEAG